MSFCYYCGEDCKMGWKHNHRFMKHFKEMKNKYGINGAIQIAYNHMKEDYEINKSNGAKEQ